MVDDNGETVLHYLARSLNTGYSILNHNIAPRFARKSGFEMCFAIGSLHR